MPAQELTALRQSQAITLGGSSAVAHNLASAISSRLDVARYDAWGGTQQIRQRAVPVIPPILARDLITNEFIDYINRLTPTKWWPMRKLTGFIRETRPGRKQRRECFLQRTVLHFAFLSG
jgi:hypothetical protein